MHYDTLLQRMIDDLYALDWNILKRFHTLTEKQVSYLEEVEALAAAALLRNKINAKKHEIAD